MAALLCCQQDANMRVLQDKPIAHYSTSELLEIKTNNGEVKEQIVTVEGYIYDINHINNRNTILLSSQQGENATVICDMQKNQSTLLTNLKKGELVMIKGIYKGSLNDVILLNCILSNKPSNE